MKIKIEAPRAWGIIQMIPRKLLNVAVPDFDTSIGTNVAVRIVRETDWKKIIKIIQMLERIEERGADDGSMWKAMDTLRKKK